MKTFEYKVVRGSSEDEFNALGQEGWELVCGGLVGGLLTFYFKREVTVKKAASKKKEDK